MLSSVRRRFMSSHAASPPIVAVIGSTGVGKSQLAVSLAQSLAYRSSEPELTNTCDTVYSARAPAHHARNKRKGLVLSADSMQLYKGLDVITNKMTVAEMGGVEHWGLDMIQPGKEHSWDVGKWCLEAGHKVDALPSDTLPIICGGTHTFVQHFLFPPPEMSFSRPRSPKSEGKQPENDTPLQVRWVPPCPRPPVPPDLEPEMIRLLETFWQVEPEWPSVLLKDSEQALEPVHESGPSKTTRPTLTHPGKLYAMHQLLANLDPAEAGRWSWRDGRKVRRSLERWWETGLTTVGHADAASEDMEGKVGRRARFRTLIFWVYEPLDQLKSRLDGRVDKMVENGLLREVVEMRDIATEIYGSLDRVDYAEGIFQAIGFKEFDGLPLPHPDPSSHPHYKEGLSVTKLRTHRYARRQIKWIRGQLLPVIREAQELGGEVYLYILRGGETDEALAASILEAFLTGQHLPDPHTVGHPAAPSVLKALNEGPVSVPDIADRQQINAHKQCAACSQPNEPFVIIQSEWDRHLESKQHLWNTGELQRRRNEVIATQKARQAEVRAQREAMKAGSVPAPPAAEAPANAS